MCLWHAMYRLATCSKVRLIAGIGILWFASRANQESKVCQETHRVNIQCNCRVLARGVVVCTEHEYLTKSLTSSTDASVCGTIVSNLLLLTSHMCTSRASVHLARVSVDSRQGCYRSAYPAVAPDIQMQRSSEAEAAANVQAFLAICTELGCEPAAEFLACL